MHFSVLKKKKALGTLSNVLKYNICKILRLRDFSAICLYEQGLM